tara:strand:- start:224 stop:862 length:639 start_codon:yes stop_codon:yes gene_type:complete
MPVKKDFEYAKSFKSINPCHKNKVGGNSLFEMYHGLKNKIVKKGGRKISKKKNNKSTKLRGGNKFPKNPPYMLSTAPHKPGVRNLVAPASMTLYERSFQGPFPSKSGVNFKLERPFPTNQLLVEPTPMNGGKKKKKVVRKISKKGGTRVKRSIKKVVRNSKRVVRKNSKKGKSVVRKVSNRRKVSNSRKVSKSRNFSNRKKVSNRKVMRGGG